MKMISKILTVCALMLIPLITNADIDNWCLECICQVESKCKSLPCQWDGDALSCGYYQMKYVYWIDCGYPGVSFEKCAADRSCSETCVRAYMRRYGTRCTGGRTPNCVDYARIHNGGPGGCMSPNTIDYGNRVSACYNG